MACSTSPSPFRGGHSLDDRAGGRVAAVGRQLAPGERRADLAIFLSVERVQHDGLEAIGCDPRELRDRTLAEAARHDPPIEDVHRPPRFLTERCGPFETFLVAEL